MKKIIIFGGTTEGRVLSEYLSDEKIFHDVCVATRMGELSMQTNEYVSMHTGRLDVQDMINLIRETACDIVVDATHPYAEIVSENIREAVKCTGIEYIRVLRDDRTLDDGNSNLHYYDSFEACIGSLISLAGNILFTTGSKNIKDIPDECKENILERSYFRVLPGTESIALCDEAGISPRNIIAMYGPFSEKMNEVMITDYKISHLVTKLSGSTGGTYEKIIAAQNTGTAVHIIGRPVSEEGLSVETAFEYLCGHKLSKQTEFNVSIIGIGMGNSDTLTVGATKRIKEADIILGASRMIEPYLNDALTKAIYDSDEIVSFLKDKYESILQNDIPSKSKWNIAVLFSGDSGFYSGANKLAAKIRELEFVHAEIIPGISSVSYFASRLGVNYSDTCVVSLHGKSGDIHKVNEIVSQIMFSPYSFVLLSGKNDIPLLIDKLKMTGNQICDYSFTAGINLSYENEQIVCFGADNYEAAVSEIPDRSLIVLYIVNQSKSCKPLCITLDDDEFIRDRVPMTKADIRHLCISKLGLTENAVCFDCGSGTGSVAIEIAKQDPTIDVYAIEYKDNAIELIEENIKHFGVSNVIVCRSKAPDGLVELPVPTHAFIGGSSGELETIVDRLIQRNPYINIVITAVTIETVSVMSKLIRKYDGELIQVQVSTAKTVGEYNLMEAGNPIYIATIKNSYKKSRSL